MSCIHNEELLETIYEEVCEEFPTLSEEQLEKITYQRFENMSW